MTTKSLTALLIATITFVALLPRQAEAGHPASRIVSYHSCGAPVHLVPVLCGYDSYGNPVYHYRQEVRGCKCGQRSHAHSSHSRSSYGRSRISTGRSSYHGRSSYNVPSRSSHYRSGYRNSRCR